MAPTLAFVALWSLARGGLVGVAPEDEGRYAGGSGAVFECFDGSATFSAAAVNDDFCDCPDGSDEPGTAACAGRPAAKFYCRNAGSVPRQLYASRVRDGVCDCCDGSDEAPGRCGQTCEAEGAVVRAERERRRTALVEGLRILKESEDEAQAAKTEWRKELEVLEGELPALEAAEAEAQAKADEARRVAEEARRAQVAAEVAQSGAVFSEDFEGPEALERWRRAVGGSFRIVDDPKGQRGKVLAMSSCTWGGDAFSLKDFSCSPESRCKISFWARGAPWQGFSRGTKRTEDAEVDAHSWLAVPAANPDFADRLLSTQSSDDWAFYEYEFPVEDGFQMLGSPEVKFSTGKVHIMVQAHDSTGLCRDTMFDDFKVQKDNTVAFIDVDGDKVEFKISDLGGLDAYANDHMMVQNVTDFGIESGYVTFGGYRAQPKDASVLGRVQRLWERRSWKSETAAGEEGKEERAGDAQEEPSADAPKTPEISEYAKWALDQDSGATAAAPDADEDDSSDSGGRWSRIDNKRAAFGDSEADRAQREAEGALEEVASKVRERRKKRDDLGQKLKRVEDEPRWFAMSDACVEKDVQQYKYKICFFGEATQDHVSLGRFKEWEPGAAAVLLFKNGQHCPGGPARSLRVLLVCGAEGAISDVSEPSRCTYEAEVVHPSACREEDLRELEEPVHNRVLRPHEEL